MKQFKIIEIYTAVITEPWKTNCDTCVPEILREKMIREGFIVLRTGVVALYALRGVVTAYVASSSEVVFPGRVLGGFCVLCGWGYVGEGREGRREGLNGLF